MLRYKSLSARVRPWSDTDTRAFLIISGGHGAHTSVPTPEILETWMHTVATWGYSGVRTNALGPALADAFTEVGFSVAQKLTLLEADLSRSVAAPLDNDAQLPRGTVVGSVGGAIPRASLLIRGVAAKGIIGVDEAAFPPEWALDRSSLRDALRATPRSRVFHHGRISSPAGFLLVGIGGSTSYIQRLAVHPSTQRLGIGRDLMERGLAWSRRAGATRAVVNTEWNNTPALTLYRSVGFVPLEQGLAVVERSLA